MTPRRHLLAALLLGTLSACLSVGPDHVAPDPGGFAPAAYEYGEAYGEALPLANWWTAFDDPVLADLVNEGLARNRTLAAAAANLEAARAELGLARKNRLPTDETEATLQETRFSAASSPFAGGQSLPNVSLVSLGTGAGWEVDLFGRVRRTIEIASADLGAAEADLADLRIVIAADIADTYMALRGGQARLGVARRNADAQRETLDLTTTIRDLGSGTDLDVQRARAQLATTLSTVPALEADVETAANALAFLTGRVPENLSGLVAAGAPVPVLDRPINIADPASLLRRRPDILAAERQLAAATSGIGLVIAEAFPRLDLIGSVSLQSDGFSGFGSAPSLAFAGGPSLTWSLTNMLRAGDRAAAASARAEAAFALYEETVLAALAETESALSRLSRLQEQALRLQEAETASGEAARLARFRYERGASGFLEVLDSELRALEAADRRVVAEIGIARAQVALFRALRAGD